MTSGGQALIVGDADPVHEPSWEVVERAARSIGPGSSAILYKSDGRHIRGDGARLMHTIVFYERAETPPFVIGRRKADRRRGKAILDGQRVLVSSLEYWAQDGVEVFRAFYEDRSLEEQFALRDPREEYSPARIREMISATAE